ncbi:uncharacterized protein LOC135620443 [Musa acuminata AAA Group]|uniref:uncharacterized protein LOC135620443 n=1 Tax=Musa acuminata AAA Group TaxID=214697 RepID=UPI0031D2CB25
MRTPPVGSRATTTKGFQREWEKRVDHVLQNLIANRWLRLSDVGTNSSLSCTPPRERASDGCYGNEDGDHKEDEEYTNKEDKEYTDDEDTNREDEDEDDYTDDKDSDEGRDLGKGAS